MNSSREDWQKLVDELNERRKTEKLTDPEARLLHVKNLLTRVKDSDDTRHLKGSIETALNELSEHQCSELELIQLQFSIMIDDLIVPVVQAWKTWKQGTCAIQEHWDAVSKRLDILEANFNFSNEGEASNG